MTTKLDKPIRREIVIDGEPFTVVITPQGLRLTRKRFRSGKVVSWRVILDGSGLVPHGDGRDSAL